MKFPARSAAWLLPLLLTACIHKTKQSHVPPTLAPPVEDVPLVTPDKAPANLPPPEITAPAPVNVPATTAQQEPPKPAPRRKRPAKSTQPAAKNNAPAAKSTQPPVQESPQQQASNTGPEVPAIGQLSSGEPANLRTETATSIAETEHGLSGITRTLNDQEQKTSMQIKEFLKQAKTALASGDVDGAHTLAAKAKVLLGELSQ